MDPLYLALLLYCVAAVLAMVDLFVPSGGMLLLIAAATALAAILFAFRSSQTMGMAMITLVAASVPTFAFLAIKIWPHTPIGKRVILNLPESSESSVPSFFELHQEFIGSVVVCDSPLLPAGQIRVGGRAYNAVAESGVIETGQVVEVVDIKERNLVVRVTDKEPDQQGASSASSSATEAEGPTADNARTPAAGNLLDRPANELGLDSLDS